MVMTEEAKITLVAEMDEAAKVAAKDLEMVIIEYPDAAKAFGAWVKSHKGTAGLKRLARLIESLA
jgi:hypothetical protein